MSNTDFPFEATQANAQAETPTQQDSTSGLADRWRSWMSDPHNRASLMQFGAALSQPLSAGQNWAGQIGSAFGQAGEASDRITALQLKQQEAESKATDREARAEDRESRATTAEGRLDLARESERRRAATQAESVALRRAHDTWAQTKDISKMNVEARKAYDNAILIGSIPATTSFEQYKRDNGLGYTAPSSPAPSTAPAEPSTKPPGQPMSGPVKVRTPEEAAALSPGTPYETPDGRQFTR